MKSVKKYVLIGLLGVFLLSCAKEKRNSDVNPKLKYGNLSVNSGINSNLIFENTLLMTGQGNYDGYISLVSDMNGDGNGDVIMISPQNGRAVVWLSNGTNLVVPAGNPAWMENQGNYAGHQFMTADMNGDGKADLVAVSPEHGRAVVWLSNGSGFIISPGNPAWMENQGNYVGHQFMVADMNGDGKADLVAVSPEHGRAIVWLSNGSNFVIPAGNPAWMENQGNYAGHKFMVADMTGDGKADLVAISSEHGRVVVWPSNGSNFVIPAGNPAWMENQGNYMDHQFMVADMTGDGKADLVAISPKHGRAVVWASNGSQLIIPSGNPAWMENQGDFSDYTFGVTLNGSDFSGNKKSDLFAVSNKDAKTVVWSLKHNLWKSTLQRISNTQNEETAQLPYLVYIPERDKLVMQFYTSKNIGGDLKGHRTFLMNSTDGGYNWSDLHDFLRTDRVLGLTNAGNGVLYSFTGNVYSMFFRSTDDGMTWDFRQNSTPYVETLETWDPVLVLNNSGSQKIVQIGYFDNHMKIDDINYFSQPYIRSSVDSGDVWTAPKKIDALKGFNEVTLLVAGNGDWIAACRKDPDHKYAEGHTEFFDTYGGLSMSVSKDQGRTWEIPKTLFEYGRQQASMILLNDGHTILLTYAVRKGGCLGISDNFSDSFDGHPYYGIEAVASHDNGKTWDVANRYVLSKWKGNIPVGQYGYYYRSCQSTSTVQLPDGTLLTAYGTGQYKTAGKTKADWKLDIDMVRWRN